MKTHAVLFATVLTLSLALLVCCGGAGPNAAVEETSLAAADQPEPASEPSAPVCEGTPSVARADLDALLAEGPASLLGKVQSDSYKIGSRFVGFRIVSFRTELDPCLDLRIGDVVMKVNGKPIERPEHYFKVFEALKTAEEITFDIMRDGREMRLTLPVI